MWFFTAVGIFVCFVSGVIVASIVAISGRTAWLFLQAAKASQVVENGNSLRWFWFFFWRANRNAAFSGVWVVSRSHTVTLVLPRKYRYSDTLYPFSPDENFRYPYKTGT